MCGMDVDVDEDERERTPARTSIFCSPVCVCGGLHPMSAMLSAWTGAWPWRSPALVAVTGHASGRRSVRGAAGSMSGVGGQQDSAQRQKAGLKLRATATATASPTPKLCSPSRDPRL
jgi:hypothetical protein